MPLTDTQIRNAKPCEKPIKMTDGRGLYVEVRPTGTKLFRFRYRIGGKENVFAAGQYVQATRDETKEQAQARRKAGRMTLAEARVCLEEWRGLVKQGIHPANQRRAERLAVHADSANTFETVAREWMGKKSVNWTPYYARQVETLLSNNVFPHIGNLPIRSVTAAHLLEVIKRVEERGAETVALLLRQWSSAIFRYAVVTLRADSDPAAALKGAIHRPKVQHHKPFYRDQIAELVSRLESYGGYRTTVIALRLMLLTFVRTVELRAALWDEFDRDRAEWRIPEGRMKNRRAHIVPLSKQAVELLRELHTLTGGCPLLLPNQRNPRTCMTATTLNRSLERLGFNGRGSIGFSAHGFRATASTILNEMGFRPDVIERQLAHAERNKVRASYNQAEYLEERQTMMQRWADFIDEIVAGESER